MRFCLKAEQSGEVSETNVQPGVQSYESRLAGPDKLCESPGSGPARRGVVGSNTVDLRQRSVSSRF